MTLPKIGALIDILVWVVIALYMFEVLFRPKRMHIFLRDEKQREVFYKKIDGFFPSKIIELTVKTLFVVTFPLLIIHDIAEFISNLSK